MKDLLLFAVLVTLPQLLGGRGEKDYAIKPRH